jgi:hypothetical protein
MLTDLSNKLKFSINLPFKFSINVQDNHNLREAKIMYPYTADTNSSFYQILVRRKLVQKINSMIGRQSR